MKTVRKISFALVFSTLVAITPISANAERHEEGRAWHHGNIHEFHVRDIHHWRSGYWHHGYYESRFGWWWVVAGMWYFYPQPIYPYPDPYIPPVVVMPPAQAPVQQSPTLPAQPQFWYYCESAKGYYPYVPSCPEEWKMVPATPSASGAPAK